MIIFRKSAYYSFLTLQKVHMKELISHVSDSSTEYQGSNKDWVFHVKTIIQDSQTTRFCNVKMLVPKFIWNQLFFLQHVNNNFCQIINKQSFRSWIISKRNFPFCKIFAILFTINKTKNICLVYEFNFDDDRNSKNVFESKDQMITLCFNNIFNLRTNIYF
jgi:hypothetical protein